MKVFFTILFLSMTPTIVFCQNWSNTNVILTNPAGYPYGFNINTNFTGNWAREFSFSNNGTGKLFSFGMYGTDGNLNYGYIGGNSSQNTVHNSAWMVFKPNGYVGIGTISPLMQFHVVHSNNSGVKIETDDAGENTAKLQVLFNYNSNAAERNAIIELGRDVVESSSYKWRFRANSNYTYGNLSNLYIEYLRGGEYERFMIFKNDGNIGIGNISPTEKLTVDGTILAEEVKVQNVPQSDYVFEPDYNLLPITEVETFIKENRHLPEIPSAEEFKENGVGLGEMDDMLLRKVEELTLYVIELKKENEELKTEKDDEIASLKEQNEKLNILLEQNENQDLLIGQLLTEIEKLKNNED